MRKFKERHPHGNVGPNFREDVHRRCNVCNFLAGVDGKRLMSKDKDDPLGGYICNICQSDVLGHIPLSQQKQQQMWLKEAIDASHRTVDGQKDYDEMVEDLIATWEKSQDS